MAQLGKPLMILHLPIILDTEFSCQLRSQSLKEKKYSAWMILSIVVVKANDIIKDDSHHCNLPAKMWAWQQAELR